MLTAVVTTLVMGAVGLGREYALVGVAGAPLVADVVKNAVAARRWGKRRIVGLTALLLLLDRVRGARAATGRSQPTARAILATAAVSSLAAMVLVTAPEAARGKALFSDRRTTLFSPAVRPPSDTRPPRLDVPAGVRRRAERPVRVTWPAAAVDDRDGELTARCSPRSGSVFPLGSTRVVCSASDGSGNRARASFDVVLVAPDAPVLHLPGTVSAAAAGADGARVEFHATAAGPGGTPAAVRCVPASGTVFRLGKTTVVCRAGDGVAAVSGRFQVVVRDAAPPKLLLPAPVHVTAPTAAGRTVAFRVPARDAVDGVLTARCEPASGSTFPTGTTAVTCTAADRAGNRVRGAFDVVVRVSAADAPPRLVVADVEREATSSAGAVVDYAATASDDRDGTIEPDCSPASGSTFPLGRTTVGCSVADAAGNEAAGSLTVTVVDTTPPRIALSDPVVAEATTRKGTTVRYRATAVDLVDGRVAAACSPRSGSFFTLGSTTVTCAAVDEAGNAASRRFRVEVRDTQPPKLVLPADFSTGAVFVGKSWQATIVYDASAFDVVDGFVPVACKPPQKTVVRGLTETVQRTVSCTATDAHGNGAEGSFVVTLVVPAPPD